MILLHLPVYHCDGLPMFAISAAIRGMGDYWMPFGTAYHWTTTICPLRWIHESGRCIECVQTVRAEEMATKIYLAMTGWLLMEFRPFRKMSGKQREILMAAMREIPLRYLRGED